MHATDHIKGQKKTDGKNNFKNVISRYPPMRHETLCARTEPTGKQLHIVRFVCLIWIEKAILGAGLREPRRAI